MVLIPQLKDTDKQNGSKNKIQQRILRFFEAQILKNEIHGHEG